MNVLVQLLASDSVPSKPDIASTKFEVEDNVGEGIHIHYRNLRFDMTIEEFEQLTEELVKAREELEHGNR